MSSLFNTSNIHVAYGVKLLPMKDTWSSADPATLSPCPYCQETVKKVDKKYWQLEDNLTYSLHRHQPKPPNRNNGF